MPRVRFTFLILFASLLFGLPAAALTKNYYHADGNQNITALIDGHENMVGRYLYDPFGKPLGQWGTKAEANVYRFASKEWDYKAGFYYFGRRFYDPGLQRWLNHDPIGERGGQNLYAYCRNNPVCLIDLMGFCPQWWDNLLNYLDDSEQTVDDYYGLGDRFDYQLDQWNALYGRYDNSSLLSQSINAMDATATLGLLDLSSIANTIVPPDSALAAMPFMAEFQIPRAFVGSVDALAAEGTTALSPYRMTTAGETFSHYGYADSAASFEGGLRPGGFATSVGDLSGAEAQSGLALPPRSFPPNAVYTVSPNPGTWIRANPVAAPQFGQPGGLPEFQFPAGTGSGTVSPPRLIP